MKGFTFFLEYPNKREKNKATRKELGNHSGNVIALSTDTLNLSTEGFAGIFDKPNSPVQFTTIGKEYLRERCKNISEKTAREIHPELFRRLDD